MLGRIVAGETGQVQRIKKKKKVLFAIPGNEFLVAFRHLPFCSGGGSICARINAKETSNALRVTRFFRRNGAHVENYRAFPLQKTAFSQFCISAYDLSLDHTRFARNLSTIVTLKWCTAVKVGMCVSPRSNPFEFCTRGGSHKREFILLFFLSFFF